MAEFTKEIHHPSAEGNAKVLPGEHKFAHTLCYSPVAMRTTSSA